jgi:hypothetical protein
MKAFFWPPWSLKDAFLTAAQKTITSRDGCQGTPDQVGKFIALNGPIRDLLTL